VKRFGLTLLLAAIVLAACSGQGGNAAMVNGKAIPLDRYNRAVAQAQESLVQQGLDLNTPEGKGLMAQMRSDILDQLIDEELLRQAASEQGITVAQSEVDERVQRAIQDAGGEGKFKEQLQQAKITLDEFKQLIRDQIATEKLFEKVTAGVPTSAEQVHVRQILVSSEQDAKNVVDRLLKGEDFATLARQVSEDTGSKDDGGDLGFFPRGFMDPAFDAVVFTLKVHDVTIVKTVAGYHVVQLLEREADRPLSIEAVQMAKEDAFVSWLDALRSKATIQRLVKLEPTPSSQQP
jgi:parvulin-like peptidyl-prolyl isomerase